MNKTEYNLIIHTGLHEGGDKLIDVARAMKSFHNAEFFELHSEMNDADWDGVVNSILGCKKVITV